MTVFFSQLINGLSLGSIYALIALGYRDRKSTRLNSSHP